jgi:hypothetical protein
VRRTEPDMTPMGDNFDWSFGLGDEMALFFYADGVVRFRHRCDRGARGVIYCGPRLQIGSGHSLAIDASDTPTVTPSILCEDCGTHGFVNAGVWRSC